MRPSPTPVRVRAAGSGAGTVYPMPTMASQPTSSPPAPAGGWPPVSVIMPVLDEAAHLGEAVAGVLGQDYDGELEVVLALGPSVDATDEIAARLTRNDSRVRTVASPSGRTPAALNAALAASRHGIVVRVDGHGSLPGDYVRTAVLLMEATGADNVGGIMAAEGRTPFERAAAAAMRSPFGVGAARFHTGGEAGPADTVYLGVFRREVLERLGGYDESFVRAQDWELNYRIRSQGGLVYFSPDLTVTYRPRSSLATLARQYVHYGRWRRVIMRQHPDTVNARYLAPPVAVLTVSAGTLLGLRGRGWAWLAPGGYLAGVVAASAWAGRGLPLRSKALLPVVLATMHACWGIGFLTSPRWLVEADAPADVS